MDMIHWLQHWLDTDDTKVIYILAVILVTSLLDFVAGWVNAKFNPEVTFSSSVALFGIIKKVIYFMVLVLFIPIALLMPNPIGLGSLYVLYLGYLLSEGTSLLSHLKVGDDDKTNKSFMEFLNRLVKNNEEDDHNESQKGN